MNKRLELLWLCLSACCVLVFGIVIAPMLANEEAADNTTVSGVTVDYHYQANPQRTVELYRVAQGATPVIVEKFDNLTDGTYLLTIGDGTAEHSSNTMHATFTIANANATVPLGTTVYSPRSVPVYTSPAYTGSSIIAIVLIALCTLVLGGILVMEIVKGLRPD